WLAAVHSAGGHIVDELMMPDVEPVFFTLHKQRDLGPFEGTVGVAEGAGAVLLAFRRLHALGVTFDASLLDGGADLPLVVLAQATAAILDMIGEIKKAQAMALQQTRHRA